VRHFSDQIDAQSNVALARPTRRVSAALRFPCA
jgi:hypothetical protein